jgi:hypothetical protein
MTRVILPLRVFLAALFLLLLMFQTLSIPGKMAYEASVHPAQAGERWPMTAVGVFLVLCAQVVVVGTWRLLGFVRQDRIFTAASIKWVDAIVAAFAAGWLTVAGLAVWALRQADDPSIGVIFALLLVGLAVVGLVIVVLRMLLGQAVTLRSDLEAVI